MVPALTDGQPIWGVRLPPRRGSIVVFPHPRKDNFWLTKRVIALGGQTVTIDFGDVLVDGKPEAGNFGRGNTFPEGSWRVPEGEVFVLSDNRLATKDDSRNFGPVPIRGMYRARPRSRSHR